MAFTSIPNSSIDADSPLDTTLFTYLRDNDNYLKDRFNPATGHNHDGTTDSGSPVSVPNGSITTAKIADGAVTQIKLGGDVRVKEELHGFGSFIYAGLAVIITHNLGYRPRVSVYPTDVIVNSASQRFAAVIDITLTTFTIDLVGGLIVSGATPNTTIYYEY